MLWWIPIAVAGMACLGVLTVVASTAAGRYEGQHVLTDPQEEWDAWSAEQGYGSMDVTAEQALHHELPWLPAPTVDPAPWLAQTRAELSPEARALDQAEDDAWQAYLLATDEEVMPDVSPPVVAAGERHHVSPGPGVPPSSLTVAPGPAPAPARATPPPYADPPGAAVEAPQPGPVPSRWLAEQLEILRAWSERQQAYAEILA